MKRLEYLIAYGIALASAALASLYGFMSASGYYGLAKGIGLCCVAFVGCHGPAWIAKVKREMGWPAAMFGTLATAACLGVTLYGGLGTIASGGTQARAESQKVLEDSTRAKSQLARVTAEREALKFIATDAAAVAAASDAVKAAERVRAAECDRRGPLCRQRETEEQIKRDELTKVRSHKALTDQASKLDAQIATLAANLDATPAIRAADPQASTFSQLTGFSVDTSAALYAFLFSIALETAAMFAMMVAYSSSIPKPPARITGDDVAPDRAPVPAATKAAVHPVAAERPVPHLVVDNPPAVSIIEWAGTALVRAAGEIEIDDLYMAYWQHCRAVDGRAIEPGVAVELLNRLCAECDISIHRRGKHAYLVGVRLKEGGTKSKRLGTMTRKS